jgi:5-enolpyruvylshikimate-3-phosphate synthase
VPTVLHDGPYRFFFYSADRHEPPHVHVERDASRAKFWLAPVRLARSGGFGAAELLRLERIVNERQSSLLEAWNEYFTDAE